MRLPSGENATERTESVCPSKGPETTAPVSAFQTRIVLSIKSRHDALAIRGECDRVTKSVCASKGPETTAPVSEFQTRMVHHKDQRTLSHAYHHHQNSKAACPRYTTTISDRKSPRYIHTHFSHPKTKTQNPFPKMPTVAVDPGRTHQQRANEIQAVLSPNTIPTREELTKINQTY